MWRARYREDRIEESRGMPSEVSEKVRAIVSQPVQTFQKPPFISKSGYLPPGVVRSVIMRRKTLWGRYEIVPLTRRDIKSEEELRRIPLG